MWNNVFMGGWRKLLARTPCKQSDGRVLVSGEILGPLLCYPIPCCPALSLQQGFQSTQECRLAWLSEFSRKLRWLLFVSL
jgi:hypothetical protein